MTPPSKDRPQPRPCIAEIPAFPLAAMTDLPAGAVLLNTNESRFGPSPRVLEAMQRSSEALVVNLYPAAEAYTLNEALAAQFGLEADQIVSVGGGELLLPLAMSVFAEPGSEVIYFADGFQKFRNYTLMCDARPVCVERRHDPVGAVLEAVTPSTRIVLIDNPGNPTGQLISPEAITALHAGLPRDVLLILDEAYIEFSDFGDGGLEMARDYPNVLTTRTFSKAYGLAGLRIGWGVGQADLISLIKRVIPSFPIPRPSLAGALAALADTDHLAHVIDEVKEIRQDAQDRLIKAGWEVAPSAANFLLIRAGDHAETALQASVSTLREANILVRFLPQFGGAPAIRMTLGTKDDMERVYAVMAL